MQLGRRGANRLTPVVLGLLWFGCGSQTPPPKAPATPADVVAAGKALLGQYERAYESRDVAALGALYAREADVIVVVQGRARRGWSAVQSALAETLASVDEVRLEPEKVAVVALGLDAAEVRAHLTREFRTGSATVAETGELILGLSRVGGQWLVRSEHFSFSLQ